MDLLQRRYSRRAATRILAGSALALPAALRLRPAGAVRGWCRTDPIFSLDRKVGHVYLAAPEDVWHLNDSSCDVVIYHPARCATKLIYNDPVGFGQGMSTNFKEASSSATYPVKTAQGYQIEVWARVPASDDTMPIMVEFAPGDGTVVTASKVGTANTWIKFPALLP
jgi:hypothetical protein